MSNLQVIKINGLEEFKKSVETKLETFEIIKIQNTDDYQELKKIRTNLNKFKIAADDERKRLAKQLKEQVDGVIKLIDTVIDKCDEETKSWEVLLKMEKRKEINEFLKELPNKYDFTLDRLLDDKWLNQTNNTWRSELLTILNSLTATGDMVSGFYGKDALQDLKDGLTMEEILNKYAPIENERQDYTLKFHCTEAELQLITEFCKEHNILWEK